MRGIVMTKFNKKKMKAMLITLCFATMLVGCGKEKVEYVDDGGSSTTQATNTAVNVTESSAEVSDNWQENALANNNKINATVIMPEVSEFKAIQVSENFYDEEEKEAFLNALTDEPVYKYDLNNYTKEMLDALIAECNAQLEVYEADGLGEGYEYLFDEQYALIEEYNSLKENAPDELVLATEFDIDKYLTKINGVEYEISMGNQSENYNEIIIKPTSEYMYVWGKDWEGGHCEFDEYLVADNPDNNMCTVSKEEAEKTAADFVEKLGITGMEMIDSYAASFNGYNDEDELEKAFYNGYVVSFSRVVDGISINRNEYFDNYTYNAEVQLTAQCSECYSDMVDTNYFSGGYGIENIYVIVNDEGVVYFNYENPFSVDSVLGEDLELVSFDSVKNIMIEEIESKDYYSNEIFTECKLTYFPVRDEEDRDSIAIVPVWKLSDSDYSSMVVVNAIDGSVINMGYQLFVPYEYGGMLMQ